MIDVVLTPADLPRIEAILPQSQVVILDVLRATSTIVTTLHAGANEVRLFDSLDAARTAKSQWPAAQGPILLAGESSCLKPDDFDLGNSPREHVTHKVGNATVLLATTNGTRAAVRVQSAGRIYAGSLLNAGATAKAMLPQLESLHTLFICAGTAGALALEDVVGAGAILFSLLQTTYRTDLAFTDNAWLAYHAFAAVRQRLPAALRLGQGGINVIEAGLEEDIDTCAQLDALPLVATVHTAPLRVLKIA